MIYSVKIYLFKRPFRYSVSVVDEQTKNALIKQVSGSEKFIDLGDVILNKETIKRITIKEKK